MMSPRSFGAGGVSALAIRRRTLLKGMLGAGALAGLVRLWRRVGRRQRRRGDARLELVGRGAQEGHRRGHEGLLRRHGQGQHDRPQLVPGEHQQLPAGWPGRRLRLVRRLPHAVLRRAGPGRRHQRRVVRHRQRLLRRHEAAVHRRGRQAVLRAAVLLPVGGLLPEERVRRRRVTRPPKTLDEFTALAHEDEDRRPEPDRVRRLRRLARDGHLRLPEPAHQRLRLPHRR